MTKREIFEKALKKELPNVDLSRDPDDPEFYLNEGVHHAWLGYQHFSEHITESLGDNRAEDGNGNPE